MSKPQPIPAIGRGPEITRTLDKKIARLKGLAAQILEGLEREGQIFSVADRTRDLRDAYEQLVALKSVRDNCDSGEPEGILKRARAANKLQLERMRSDHPEGNRCVLVERDVLERLPRWAA